jgi:hypothetical protein
MDPLDEPLEFGQFLGFERGERLADDVQPHARQLLDEPTAGVRDDALNDATVVGPVATGDQAMSLDSRDEAGRIGGTELEDLGDPAHGLRAFTLEQEEQPHLTQGQVPGGRRRYPMRQAVEYADEVRRRVGQPVAGIR